MKTYIGQIVEFFPGTGDSKVELPNGMESAPAIVTQIFDSHVNLTVFTVGSENSQIMTVWSVAHKLELIQDDWYYWDFVNSK